MSFDWNEYLRLAALLGGMADEAAKRSAVSRAYYCAFHAASLAVTTNKITTNPKYSRNRHKQIWQTYIDSTAKECRRIGSDGQRLSVERQEADYDPESDFPDSRVQRAIAQARALAIRANTNLPDGYVPPSGNSTIQRAISFIKDLF